MNLRAHPADDIRLNVTTLSAELRDSSTLVFTFIVQLGCSNDECSGREPVPAYTITNKWYRFKLFSLKSIVKNNKSGPEIKPCGTPQSNYNTFHETKWIPVVSEEFHDRQYQMINQRKRLYHPVITTRVL